jgi:hypothetical protein
MGSIPCFLFVFGFLQETLEYQGIVYCNVHLFGLPIEEWISDFDAFGFKEVLAMPF